MSEDQFREMIREPIATTKRLIMDDLKKLLAQIRPTNGTSLPEPPLLSIRKIAQRFHLAQRTVSAAVYAGDLPGCRTGDRTVYIKVSDADL